MANLTGPRRDEMRPKPTLTISIKSAVALFIGGYASLDPVVGRADKNADTAGYLNLGRVIEFDSPLQSGGTATGNAGGTVRAIIDLEGGIVRGVPVTGAAAETDVGDFVFLATDNLADLKLAVNVNTKAVGMIVKFNTATSFDVLLFNTETMRALN